MLVNYFFRFLGFFFCCFALMEISLTKEKRTNLNKSTNIIPYAVQIKNFFINKSLLLLLCG
ncbi:unnamed protein product [Prunus brigantina]